MASIHLAPLDRNRRFVAQTDFICRGKRYRKGQDFPPDSVTARTLRLIYESRAIGYLEDQPKPRPPKPPMSEAERDDMLLNNSKAKLQEMVRNLGVTIDQKWSKGELVDEIARVRDAAAYG